MTVREFREELAIEIELIETTIQELVSLRSDVIERELTVRERTAAAAFMAQFYGGVENILKRISRFHEVLLPTGDAWHIDLFKRFCEPPYEPLPGLLDASLASEMAPFRKFRHVVYHGYGVQLEWERMKDGIGNIESVFRRFKARLFDYLQTLS